MSQSLAKGKKVKEILVTATQAHGDEQEKVEEGRALKRSTACDLKATQGDVVGAGDGTEEGDDAPAVSAMLSMRNGDTA